MTKAKGILQLLESLPKEFYDYVEKSLSHFDPKILKILPIISKGTYIGNDPGHKCHDNAMKYKKETDLYVGYVITKDEDGWSLSEHSFNVIDGKVVEHTSLEDGWNSNTYYVGVKVPKKEFMKFSYLRSFDKISWVKRQLKRTLRLKYHREEYGR
jgi:hypothetical protein